MLSLQADKPIDVTTRKEKNFFFFFSLPGRVLRDFFLKNAQMYSRAEGEGRAVARNAKTMYVYMYINLFTT